MGETNVVITKTDRPNSYETGRAGARFKLYFDDAKDLKKQLDELKSYELWSAE